MDIQQGVKHIQMPNTDTNWTACEWGTGDKTPYCYTQADLKNAGLIARAVKAELAPPPTKPQSWFPESCLGITAEVFGGLVALLVAFYLIEWAVKKVKILFKAADLIAKNYDEDMDELDDQITYLQDEVKKVRESLEVKDQPVEQSPA